MATDVEGEISKNVQLAIKAKLTELNAYVDDELPDYIMIMIANRKEEEQMAESLSLFLGSNAQVFTKWLYESLTKLKEKKPEKVDSVHEQKEEDKQMKQQSPKSVVKKSLRWDVKSGVEHEKNPVLAVPAKPSIDSSSEAVIDILPEADDVLDEELLGSSDRNEAPTTKAAEVPAKVITVEHRISVKTSHMKDRNSSKVDSLKSIDANDVDLRSSKLTKISTKKSASVEKPKSKYSAKTKSRDDKIGTRHMKSSDKDHDSIKHKPKKLKRSSHSTRGDSSSSLSVDSVTAKHFKAEGGKKSVSASITREWDKGKGDRDHWKEDSNYAVQSQKYSSQKTNHDDDNGEDHKEPAAPTVRRLSSVIKSSVTTISKESTYASEDSDEEVGKSGSVVSKVALPQRKSRLPPGKQANRSLLLKAVSEAENSVRHFGSALLSGKSNKVTTEEKSKNNAGSTTTVTKPKIKVQIEQNVSKKKLKRRKLVTEEHARHDELAPKKSKADSQESVPLKTSSAENNTDTLSIAESCKSDKDGKVNEANVAKQVFVTDQRRFISRHRTLSQSEINPGDKKKQPSVPENDSAIHFDQRNLSVREKDVLNVELENKEVSVLSVRKSADGINSKEKLRKKSSKKSRSPSPCFIVTLDGSVPKTGKNKPVAELPLSAVQVKISKPKFRSVPIQAPNKPSKDSVSTLKAKRLSVEKPAVVPQTSNNEQEHAESTDAELLIMREKLLKMQEEAMKLKLIQQKQLNIINKKVPLSQPVMNKPDDQKSIHIANVHFSATEKQLTEHFGICGKVKRATILKDAYTGHPKGFAYLEFEEQSSVDTALALDNTMFYSRMVKVSRKGSEAANLNFISAPHFPARSYRMSRPRTQYRARYAAVVFQPRFRAITPSRNKTWIKQDQAP